MGANQNARKLLSIDLVNTNNCYFNTDNGLINAVLLIDLKKAFDTIDHKILLSKLELYGLRGTTQNLWETIYLIEHGLLHWALTSIYDNLASFAPVFRLGSQNSRKWHHPMVPIIISELNLKVSKVLTALRRLKPLCPQPVLIIIYKSLLLPHVDYCNAVWCGTYW